MKLFVGLGNPGAEYAGNRHNIGFMALDRIAADHGFSPWKKAFHGLVSEGRLGGDKVLLLKPETFMNRSGQAVQAAVTFHKLALADVVVFHDELDLPPGKLRCKMAGGHAGHNGLRSIHSHLGEAYGRVRLGIGHPGSKEAVAGYVLHDFAKAERDWLEPLLQGISEGAAELAQGEEARFMNAVALRTTPQRKSPRQPPEGAARPAEAAGNPAPGTKPATAPKPANPAEPPSDAAESPLSALQKLAQKFRS